MTALILSEFEYTYPGREQPSLRIGDLQIDRGEFVVVAGSSGSGKSTLLRTASGLVPHFYGGKASGSAEVCGRDLRDSQPAELAAVCGSLAQDPESQVVMGRVWDEIALPLENCGWPAAEVGRGVEEVALALGIEDLLERRTSELSGGELQRVALAAALARRPRLVTLDEPTSQLDPVAGDELIHTLRRLNEEWGVTVLLAEQRLERCLHAADRVLTLEGGGLEFDGDLQAFLTWAATTGRDHLLTPSALAFHLAGIDELPSGVKAARQALGRSGLSELTEDVHEDQPKPKRRTGPRSKPIASIKDVWREHEEAIALRGVSFEVSPGDRIALMGRNGAGKSTLLRLFKGLDKPDRGKVDVDGDVGLLLQNPNDYLVHARVIDELTATPVCDRAGLLEAFGLAGLSQHDPRDLSGGERQRLALAIVLQDSPRLLLLDEPTRGMDRKHRGELVTMISRLNPGDQAAVVATHDPEFAARFATRVVLLGRGEVIADGTPVEVFRGGWHFSTEIARVLSGAGGALIPEDGASLIKSARFRQAQAAGLV